MNILPIVSVMASQVEIRGECMKAFRSAGAIDEESEAIEIKEAIKVLDITRQLLFEEYRLIEEYLLTQRKTDNVAKCLETSDTVDLESLPTEILRDIVDLLPLQDIEQLSCASKRLREICLPSLFRRVKVEFSQAGFEKLSDILKSDARYHVVSFTYIVPDLLRTGKYLLCYDGSDLTLLEFLHTVYWISIVSSPTS
jgi:hypothetical protein